MRTSPLDGMTVKEYDAYQDELNVLLDGGKIRARRVQRSKDKKPRIRRTRDELTKNRSQLNCKVRRLFGFRSAYT